MKPNSPPITPRPRARRAPLIDLPVTLVPSARSSAWDALVRRLLGPVSAPPEPVATDDPAHLPAEERQGKAGSA